MNQAKLMEREKVLKGLKFYGLIVLAIACAAVGGWLLLSGSTSTANAALAEYQIDKMTCGSCVGNIESALLDIDGVASVEVNLTSSRGRVTYDPERASSQLIAETISAAGYPAKLRLELNPAEYKAMQQKQEQLGQDYLARIGDRLLARQDFEVLVAQRAGGAVDPGQLDKAWQTTWKDVLQRELMLSAAEKNKIVIQDGEVDVRLDELRQRHNGLEQIVTTRYGGMDNFRARLREDMTINRNIENHVYAGLADPKARQGKLQSWYAELQNNTEVIIFDPKLKALSQGSGGCACCNS
jgi:copper chaperone CopZ